jgi:hypothetical protein
LEKTRSSGPNPGAVPLLAVDDHATGDRPEQRQARVGDVTAGGLEDDVEFAPHGGPHVVHPVRAGVVDTEIGAEPAGEVQLGRRAGGRDDLLAHLLAPRTADLQAHLAAAGLDLDRRARAVATWSTPFSGEEPHSHGRVASWCAARSCRIGVDMDPSAPTSRPRRRNGRRDRRGDPGEVRDPDPLQPRAVGAPDR